jgi:predicted DNA-binding transcriptional regulator AlpA
MPRTSDAPRPPKILRIENFPDYGTRAELSAFTGLSTATLSRYATEGIGPRVTRMGRAAVRYKREDVVAWLDGLRDAKSA